MYAYRIERERREGGEREYWLSLIFEIKPSTVVTSPPRVPLASSNSSSGIFTLAVSDLTEKNNIKRSETGNEQRAGEQRNDGRINS